MRKTGLYGFNSDENIEWPTANDLLQMANNFPTKIKDLKYKSDTGLKGFGAFQVILSNGMSSPVFNADSTNFQDMQSLNISDYSLVKRFNGTKQNSQINLSCLIFSKKNGIEITKVEMKAI